MNIENENILKKSTILLIEDNEELRKKFKMILETYVEKVYEASNGNDAINIFNLKKPNIIITDVKVPSVDGLEIVTFIRRIDRKIPIVVISAYTNKSDLLEFASLNLIQYLVKPVDFEQLNNVLNKCAIELHEAGLIEAKLDDTTIYSFSQKVIFKDSKIIHLTPSEIKFLELLINNKKKLISLNQIEYELYENKNFSESSLNNLISKLRKKTGIDTIKNLHKTGYILT